MFKALLVCALLFLSGCAAHSRHSLLLDSRPSKLFNYEREPCEQRSMQINTFRKTLTIRYKNCDVIEERILEEREYPQWGIEQ